MPTDLPLQCDCGRVRGVATVSPATGNRMLCYCDDCQAFVHFLDRRDVLDAWGGTDIFQMAPGQLRITDGADQLRCVRLVPKGMFRFYAACCRAPIANTIPSLPFVGVHCSFMKRDVQRDEVLGKPRAYAMQKFAVGKPSNPEGAMIFVVLRVLRLMLGWIVRGQAKPSPFFDAQKHPIVEPQILTDDERAKLPRGISAAS
jgi:Family of unknown function (DUF6151)